MPIDFIRVRRFGKRLLCEAALRLSLSTEQRSHLTERRWGWYLRVRLHRLGVAALEAVALALHDAAGGALGVQR
jgi:L-alanine-DL-glutamate epimerase-like enolase superfamily enzyme